MSDKNVDYLSELLPLINYAYHPMPKFEFTFQFPVGDSTVSFAIPADDLGMDDDTFQATDDQLKIAATIAIAKFEHFVERESGRLTNQLFKETEL